MAGVSAETIFFAMLGGIAPTFLWLWFWLTQESDRDASGGLLFLTYLGGMIGVAALLPLKQFILPLGLSTNQITVLYAGLEEFTKFTIVALMAFGATTIFDGSDYTIYLVTGALGFSALENTLYLITPLRQAADFGTILATGNLRFLGATVLHTVSVAIVGTLFGIAYGGSAFRKFIHIVVGLALAIGLHTTFNHFIMLGTQQGTTVAIAGIWFVAVIVILLYERMKPYNQAISMQADLA